MAVQYTKNKICIIPKLKPKADKHQNFFQNKHRYHKPNKPDRQKKNNIQTHTHTRTSPIRFENVSTLKAKETLIVALALRGLFIGQVWHIENK